jgi:hypothetical protein
MKRRSSISGTERRANMPLTPPRRVSAPLAIFILQKSLKLKNSGDLETQSAVGVIRENEMDEQSTYSMPARLDGSKITNPSSNKSKSKAKVKADLVSSGHDTFYTSPLARHRQSIGDSWKTISLPDKNRIRNLEDTSACVSTSSSHSFDAEEGNEQKLRKTRTFSADSGPPSDPKLRAKDSSWARVKLKAPTRKGVLLDKPKQVLSNMSDHTTGSRTSHSKQGGGEEDAGRGGSVRRSSLS